ncbi:MAG TPA: hypothetical protein VKB37_07970 [Jatrophihabitantaceae bacterium]|nr:hypothetical protein [Jatrophihabitantaceae bacterium]
MAGLLGAVCRVDADRGAEAAVVEVGADDGRASAGTDPGGAAEARLSSRRRVAICARSVALRPATRASSACSRASSAPPVAWGLAGTGVAGE